MKTRRGRILITIRGVLGSEEGDKGKELRLVGRRGSQGQKKAEGEKLLGSEEG